MSMKLKDRLAFVERLKEFISQRGYGTKIRLARESGVSPSLISPWLSGDYLPTGRSIAKIAYAMDNIQKEADAVQAVRSSYPERVEAPKARPNDGMKASRQAAADALRQFFDDCPTYGLRADFARFLGVTWFAVQQWVKGTRLPRAGYLPKIRQWLAIQKAKQEDAEAEAAEKSQGVPVEEIEAEVSEEYVTGNLNEAAFLLERGAKLVRAEKVPNTKSWYNYSFTHPAMASLRRALSSFEEVTISPAKLFACREELKRMAYRGSYNS